MTECSFFECSVIECSLTECSLGEKLAAALPGRGSRRYSVWLRLPFCAGR
ncbi:hypothetical protein [Anaerovibrio slackiae]